MPSQIITLAALENEYKLDGDSFRQKAIDLLLPSAVHGTALAARGEHPFRYPQRWACLAGLKAAGMLGMGLQVNVALVIAERLGVKSESEASQLLDSAARARTATPEDTLRLAESIVRDRVRSDPDYRRMSMQRIYGLIDAPSSVSAA